jgi:MFS family permease
MTRDTPNASGRSAVATWALAVAQLVSWGSVYYAFSLFVVPMEGAMGWSRTATNAALSVGLLVSGLAAYPVGTWIDHGHGRRVMVCGTVLASAMLAVWSQAHGLVTLFVVWIGLGVAMAATLYDPVFAVITRDFPGSFRKKITLITLVAGFASTVFIPLTQLLVDWLQWRGALLALAGFNLAICLPIHVFAIGRDAPREDGPDYKALLKAANAAATRRALRTPTFWALAVCFTAYYATFAALTFHLVPLMAERRVSPALILTTMAVIGPAQVLARVLWFTVGRNVRGSIVGVVITTAFPASVVVLMCAGTSPALLILFAVLYGGANGMMTILRGTIVQEVMWTEGYGAVSGLLSMPSNIAKGIAPISAAAIWTAGGNYVPVEWTVLLVSLVSAVAFILAIRLASGKSLASIEPISNERTAMPIRKTNDADLTEV